jgi:cytochrome P450
MPMMLDVAGQLMDKWERLNIDDDVDVLADMTRLTLDMIALCGFGLPVQLLLPRDAAPVRASTGR